jgi:small subunit ribosomal protein S6e
MAELEFKVTVNDTKNGKSYQTTVKESHAYFLIGKKIGDEIDGMFLGLPGFLLQITGGCDRDGFPMRRDLPTAKRKKLLLTKSTGLRKVGRGVRKRKSVRGNVISEDVAVISMKIIKYGAADVAAVLGKKVSDEKT